MSFFLCILIFTASCIATLSQPNPSNSTRIFNAISNAMRQFGSTLQHNGMSFAVITMPEDTELYHGTFSPVRINGTEWLAFEPEHAMMFANPHPKNQPKCKEPDLTHLNSFQRRALHTNQKPLSDDKLPPCWPSGYFHTYRTKRPLQLLYLDGQAAAKSSFGTQDTQDKVLLAGVDLGHDHLILREYRRAHALCKLSEDAWEKRIDGFVRMEGGFELILCSFLDTLDVVSIVKPETPAYGSRFWFSYDLAIGADFDGTAQGKMKLDFGRFVSAFAYDGLTVEDGLGRPRVDNASVQFEVMRGDITEMIMREETPLAREYDWQLVADAIVSRYARRIEIIASGILTDLELLQTDLYSAIQPFVDYKHGDTGVELRRCTAQLLPTESRRGESIAARAVFEVLTMICSTFLQASNETNYDVALSLVRDLKQTLDWQTWKKCSECGDFEVCMLPVWPLGIAEDFVQPRCGNESTRVSRQGYWDWV